MNVDPSGEGLARKILEYFDQFKVQHDDLKIVGMDGTTVNTDYKVQYIGSHYD